MTDHDPHEREVVVVTGASAGVGRAIARAFARRGASIGLLARGMDRLEETRREVVELGGEAIAIPTDVADYQQVEQAAVAIEEIFGPIDVWVNNAMVSVFSPVHALRAAEVRRVTEVSYLGYVHGTLAVELYTPVEHDPQLARGSHLVNDLGHCAECHTPRNGFGILDHSRAWEGGPFEDGSIEPIDANSLAGWTEEDFAFFLFLGIKPDGEFVGGKMEAVVEHNTSKLTEEDQQAIAAYFIRGRNM